MKRYIYFALLCIVTTACKTTGPVYGLSEVHRGKAPKSYFKDLNNELDGYDGTYLYNNGTSSLKIVLKKKIKSLANFYQDLVVGEYQYIKNGVELNNTLANININYTNEEVNHIITGSRVLTGTKYGCPDCSPTEKRLRLSFVEPKTCCLVGLDIRKITVKGVPAIKVLIFSEGSAVTLIEGHAVPPDPRILPPGEYVMIKQ